MTWHIKTGEPVPLPLTVTAIQVVPVIENQGQFTPQFEGPTDETTGWSIYKRMSDGTVEWFADLGVYDEVDTMFVAHFFAQAYGVDIEPQPWRKS